MQHAITVANDELHMYKHSPTQKGETKLTRPTVLFWLKKHVLEIGSISAIMQKEILSLAHWIQLFLKIHIFWKDTVSLVEWFPTLQRHFVPFKPLILQRSVTFQKNWILNSTTVRTSNLTTVAPWDMRFTEQWLWRLPSSGMLCHTVWYNELSWPTD